MVIQGQATGVHASAVRLDVLVPHLVNGDAVNVAVVHKPDDLIREELSIVLAAQVRLGGLRAAQASRGQERRASGNLYRF